MGLVELLEHFIVHALGGQQTLLHFVFVLHLPVGDEVMQGRVRVKSAQARLACSKVRGGSACRSGLLSRLVLELLFVTDHLRFIR